MEAWKPFKLVIDGDISMAMHRDFLCIETMLMLMILGDYHE